MALINRISRLVKADFHAVLDQIEEPGQLLKQAIRDMEDDLAETEKRIVVCAHDQEALAVRKRELDSTLAEIDGQLDLGVRWRRSVPGGMKGRSESMVHPATVLSPLLNLATKSRQRACSPAVRAVIRHPRTSPIRRNAMQTGSSRMSPTIGLM